MPRRTVPALPTDPVAAFTTLAGNADPTLVLRARSYQPRFPEPSWPVAAPWVALGIIAAGAKSPQRVAASGRWSTIHVTACLDRGASRTLTGVWGADSVEHTLATVEASDHARANLATTLRRASVALTGSSGPVLGRKVPRRDPLGPYTSDEFADLVDAATTIAAPLWRTRICLLVAMHAGAGLRTADLNLLRPNHATVDGRGVLVRVPGVRGRLVPVRVELEHLAAAALDWWQAARPDGPLLPANAPSSRCFDRAPLPSGVARLTSARLRATWATWLLAGGASVQAVVTAADIATVESWFAPVRLLADLPEDTYLAQVRGTTSPFARGRALDGQPWPSPVVPLAVDGGGR